MEMVVLTDLRITPQFCIKLSYKLQLEMQSISDSISWKNNWIDWNNLILLTEPEYSIFDL